MKRPMMSYGQQSMVMKIPGWWTILWWTINDESSGDETS